MLSVVLFSSLFPRPEYLEKYILFSLKNVQADAEPVVIYGQDQQEKNYSKPYSLIPQKRF